MCVCKRERVRACQREREREREIVCVCKRERRKDMRGVETVTKLGGSDLNFDNYIHSEL